MRWLSVMSLATLVRGNVDRQLSSHGRNSRDRETGAVAAIVVVLFGFGVLLGLGAIVLDTGSLLYERRQLQNGADAAALAAGKDCASSAACTPGVVTASVFTATTALTALAGANASADGATTIESICGNSVARQSIPGLSVTNVCAPGTGQLVDCPPVPSEFATAPYIEVRTKTLNANGTSILPPILAQTLVGGYVGETVRACSRAAWLPAGTPTGPVLPVAFTSCQWAQATGYQPGPNPAAQAPRYETPPSPGASPGYGSGFTPWPLLASAEVVLYTESPQHQPGSCNTWNSHVAPGTFGELAQTNCGATVTTDNWVQAANGNAAPCDLTNFDALRGHVVNVPIFDCYTPNRFDWTAPPVPAPTCNDTHPTSWYHISGYAAFYLTGFNFSGNASTGKSIFPLSNNYGSSPCSGSDRCIAGWFTTGTFSATPSAGGTPNFGTFELQFAG